jgi:hypothetical protein
MGHITMDNAENNETMMRELQRLFERQGIPFDSKDRRIRCYPHIINICVSHIVSSLTKVSDFDQDDDDSDEHEDEDGDEDGDGEFSDDGGYVGEEDEESDDEIAIGPQVEEAWLLNVKRNPVKLARTLVRTVRSSGQKREAFSKAVKVGNDTDALKGSDKKPITIQDKQLLKDVKHRWDSLYLMLRRLREMRQVCPMMPSLP